LGNPDQSTDDLLVLTEREIALMCTALDRARANTKYVMLDDYDALYERWTGIANDESTLIVGDPTVGGHRMHAVHTGADERHRLRLVVEAHIVFLTEVGDDQRATELYHIAARLGGTP
jgi:hypothetical protein